MPDLGSQELKAICNIIADTNKGLTKTELTHLLGHCKITILDDGSKSNGYTYTIGLNKRDWLYNCLANEINTTHSLSKIYSFLEASLNPISYTTEPSRQKYEYLLEKGFSGPKCPHAALCRRIYSRCRLRFATSLQVPEQKARLPCRGNSLPQTAQARSSALWPGPDKARASSGARGKTASRK